jgi:hypothetical protein
VTRPPSPLERGDGGDTFPLSLWEMGWGPPSPSRRERGDLRALSRRERVTASPSFCGPVPYVTVAL